MNDLEVRAALAEILRVVRGLADELDRYRALLPEPGSIKARVLRHKVAANAADHWNEKS